MAVVGVQRGSVTFGSGATTVDVTLTSVVLAQSLVRISHTGAPFSHVSRDGINAELTSATNLRLTRDSSGDTVDVSWEVVEFDSSVSVQTVSLTSAGATTGTAAITAVTLANAWVEYVGCEQSEGETYQYSATSEGIVEITSTTQVTWTWLSGDTPASGNVYTAQVIETSDASVQSVSSSGSGAVTISAVDAAATEVHGTYNASGQVFTPGVPAGVISGAADTTLDVGSFAYNARWYVVEWSDGTAVQRGTLAVGIGGTASSTTITSVDTAQSSVITNTAGGRGRVRTTSGTFNAGTENAFGHVELASATSIDAYIGESTATTSDTQYQVVEYATAGGGGTTLEGWARSTTGTRTRAEVQVAIAVEGHARSTTGSRTRADAQVGIAVEGHARSTTGSRTRATGDAQVGTAVTGWARSTTGSRTRAEGQVDIAVAGHARSTTASRTRAEGQVDIAVEGHARSTTESRTRATGLVEAEGELTGYAYSRTESRTRATGRVDIAVEGFARSTTASRTRAEGETSQAVTLEGWARSTTASSTRAFVGEERRREGGGSAFSAQRAVRVVLPRPPPQMQEALAREQAFRDEEEVAAALAFMLLNE